MKIVINKCYGGFGLSDQAYEWLMENKGWKLTEYDEDGNVLKDSNAQIVKATKALLGKYWAVGDNRSIEFRTNPDIVEVVETLGEGASGRFAKLKVVEIPDGIEVTIDEYDGIEWIAEKHRTWG
jgi:hypothetical protein